MLTVDTAFCDDAPVARQYVPHRTESDRGPVRRRKVVRQSDAVKRTLDKWRATYPKMTSEWEEVGIELSVRANKKKLARECGVVLKDGVWRISQTATQEKIDLILHHFRARVCREYE